ncbi:hypothetical protein Asch01_00485 [Acinetobacter schindleri]
MLLKASLDPSVQPLFFDMKDFMYALLKNF